ncbi:MAG: flippase [Ignavibacteriaceae bacterium]|nr:MAG: flippase [Chlorobiota bacterium]KXK04709.1 MAG: polysaccharide biosynthesis protein [Chlorobi bacterium OLB4]MBV6399429.1 hypothetical protein [Ignavibacteria bacterium]MCC6886727.1 flippase [Ignavibacteriales bacterium]MCE7953134.1 flippase [Chlorobi bacterium CHB7]MEB2329083.1 flippase [Ignavibacteriaceae bacterium]OQY76618.1 MAG: hypothetical protein B6D43_10605 [Ignavibacteriales bacterium UTCHB1]RIK50009.1 MAG: hypothetical protein DCC60_01145 [Ignavibacteriota bacterium]
MSKLKDSYWITSGYYTFMHRIAELVFGFGSFWLLIRILDKTDFGVWVLLQTVAAMIELARLGFIQNAQIKFATGVSETEFREINSASLWLNGTITFATVILLASIAHFLSVLWNAPKLEFILYLYCVVTVLYAPFMQSVILMQIKFNFKGIFYSHLVRLGLFFLVILYFFFANFQIELSTLLYMMIVVSFFSIATAYYFSKPYWIFSSKVNFRWVKKIFHFGKYVFGTNLNSMLYRNVDQMMIGSMLGPVPVATYNAASRILNFVEAPLSSISTIVFPKTTERIRTEGLSSARYLYEKSVGLMIAIIFPALIICLIFPELIITILAGEEYLDSVVILQVIIFISLLKPFDRQSGVFLDAIGKPRLNFLIVLTSLSINVVLNYFLIMEYGLIGAAYATLLATLVAVVISTIFLRHELTISILKPFVYSVGFYKLGMEYILAFLKKKK